MTLQVLATPAAYRAVLSAVREESDKDKLELGLAIHRPEADRMQPPSMSRATASRFSVHLREVPRLLRAAIVIDDMGRDLEAAHKLLALDYPLTYSVLPYLLYPANR